MTSWGILVTTLAAGVAVLCGLLIWAYDPEGAAAFTRGGAVTVASGFLALVYVRLVARRMHLDKSVHFNIRDLLMLTAAVGLFGAAGYALDGLVLCSVLIYTLIAGRHWKRWVEKRFSCCSQQTVTICTSAAILASYIALATLVTAILTIYVLPRETHSVFPPTLLATLWTAAMFAWMFILGDNARDGMQLVVYGLPVGLVTNVLLGLLAGAFLGLHAIVVAEWRSE